MKKSWIESRDFVESPGRINGTKWDDSFFGDNRDEEGVDVEDVYNGRGGNDVIAGYDLRDRLSGGGGIDTIYGGTGRDRIFGGSGNDTLEGGMHKDIVAGGGGADVFYFNAWGSDLGGHGMDTITDFDPREKGEWISVATLHYDGIAKFADLKARMVQQGDDVNIEFDEGHSLLVLKDVKIAQLQADDFHIYFG